MKKPIAISMLFVALAILLGHGFVGHHHHAFESYPTYSKTTHHHDHQHDHDHDTESDFDLTHVLAHLTLDVKELAFLGKYDAGKTAHKLQASTMIDTKHSLVQEQYWDFYRCKSPPGSYIFVFPQQLLPSGLRAPPCLWV